MSKLSFKAFCIEYYATHIGETSEKVYVLFKNTGLLEMLDTDYDDLHGMGMECLMQFCDEYLGGKKYVYGPNRSVYMVHISAR